MHRTSLLFRTYFACILSPIDLNFLMKQPLDSAAEMKNEIVVK